MSALPPDVLDARTTCRVCESETGAGLCARCIADRDIDLALADRLADSIRTHALRVAGAHYEEHGDVMTARRELRTVLMQAAAALGVTL